MSIFTSPPSDAVVVLLWGDRWWIEGRTEPIVFGEFSRAAETLLAEFGGERPRRVRLVYQPGFLGSHRVECPNASRPLIQQALGEEFPALHDDRIAWSYEPIIGGHARYSTVLHVETQPGLYPLVTDLTAAGIEVVGAWPLATLLNLLPDDWPDSGALTVVAAAAHLTVVYRHTPDGVRDVQVAVGSDSATAAQSAIHQALARIDVALHVAALDDTGHKAMAHFTPDEISRIRIIPWSKLVVAAHRLPQRQPSQFLPVRSWIGARSVMTAATVATVAVSLLVAAESADRFWSHRSASAHQAGVVRRLHGQVDTLRQQAKEVTDLRRELAERAGTQIPFGELLMALGRKLPSQVVLTRVHANREGFTVTGGVSAGGLTDAAWADWRAAWSASGPWQLSGAAGRTPSADFTLKGGWR